MISEIKSSFGTHLFQNGIYFIYLNEAIELTPEILEEIHMIGKKLSNGNKFPILADTSLNVTSTPEAREFGASNKYMEDHLAYALIAKNTPVKLVANFFIKYNKPKIPTRMFTNDSDAIRWLKTFLK